MRGKMKITLSVAMKAARMTKSHQQLSLDEMQYSEPQNMLS